MTCRRQKWPEWWELGIWGQGGNFTQCWPCPPPVTGWVCHLLPSWLLVSSWHLSAHFWQLGYPAWGTSMLSLPRKRSAMELAIGGRKELKQTTATYYCFMCQVKLFKLRCYDPLESCDWMWRLCDSVKGFRMYSDQMNAQWIKKQRPNTSKVFLDALPCIVPSDFTAALVKNTQYVLCTE